MSAIIAFIERHFNIFILLFILFVLMAGHAFMIHAGRPHEMVTWIETLISSVFAAMIPLLAGKGNNGSGP